MSIPVMILGESGSGKSTSIEYLGAEKTLVIQPIKKPLPFKSKDWLPFDQKTKKGSVVHSDNYDTIKKIVNNAERLGKEYVVIDDANYIMVNESLRRADETGFRKFSDMARGYVDLVTHVANHPSGIKVFFMTHIQIDESGFQRAKTVGKMIDSQVCLEGLFSIVLKAQKLDGKHVFKVVTNGQDCVKTPRGMFDGEIIDNDLVIVNEKINEFYL